MDPFNPFPNLGTVQSDFTDYEYEVSTNSGRDVLDGAVEHRPIGGWMALVLVIGMILAARLINLQVIEGTKSRVLAEDNRVRSREIRPPRGEIHDRNGQVLAQNVAAYTLELFPGELPRNNDEREAVLARVEAVTHISVESVREQIRTRGLIGVEPEILASQISHEQALVWKAQLTELPGISISKLPQREYAQIPGLGHVLGYVGRISETDRERWPDLSLTRQVGKNGLELMYEGDLQGNAGQKRIEVDAKGRIERVLAELAPTQGATLELSLDARLQNSLTTRLQESAERFGVTKAAAVALDPRTGGVLAMASLPTFDPNIFIDDARQAERSALLTNDDQPLLNRVTHGVYPSGSTLKPIIAAAALEEGTISAQTTLDTSIGAIQIGQWRFPDWKVHGLADVKRAIAESNDIFFYALGGGYEHIAGLEIERMEKWLKTFGFGEKNGIDLPGEATGLVPTDAWKRERIGEPWYIGDSYHLAIGQGYFLATPLQLATATAAIANGGALWQPYLAQAKVNPDGSRTELAPARPLQEHLATPGHLQTVRDGMRLTITDGTARSLDSLEITVGGKTGTAQFGKDKNTHSWFTGFAPFDDPKIAVAVIVEGGGESSDTAVPATKAFFEDVQNILLNEY